MHCLTSVEPPQFTIVSDVAIYLKPAALSHNISIEVRLCMTTGKDISCVSVTACFCLFVCLLVFSFNCAQYLDFESNSLIPS